MNLAQQQIDAINHWQMISAAQNSLPYIQQQTALQQLIAASNLNIPNNFSLLTPTFFNNPQIDKINSLHNISHPGVWHT